MSVPTVTIAIPTFNQASFLRLAVASALAQDYSDVRVIVSNDASTDETLQVMTEICAAEPRVRGIQQPANLGIARNTDAVLRAADTDYVVRLDSDDLLHPNYVRLLVAGMEAHPRAAYAHAAVQEIDQFGQPTRPRLLRRGGGFQSGDEALRAAASGYRVAANILLFRRSALAEVDFTRGRPDYLEDYDLSVALAVAGWGNFYSDSMLSSYRVWTDVKGVRARRKLTELKGFQHVFEKSLEPVFRDKGWAFEPIIAARRKLARRNVLAAQDPRYSREERESMEHLLVTIGGSPMLSLLMLLARFAIGRALLHSTQYCDGMSRALIKRALRSIRLARAPQQPLSRIA